MVGINHLSQVCKYPKNEKRRQGWVDGHLFLKFVLGCFDAGFKGWGGIRLDSVFDAFHARVEDREYLVGCVVVAAVFACAVLL